MVVNFVHWLVRLVYAMLDIMISLILKFVELVVLNVDHV